MTDLPQPVDTRIVGHGTRRRSSLLAVETAEVIEWLAALAASGTEQDGD